MIETKGRSNAILEDRARLMLTGVTEVESFNDQEVRLYTELGPLTVRGRELHITGMSLDTGELSVEGTVSGLSYGDETQTRRLSLWGKLWR